MGKISSAVAWAVAIANNPAHGYDQHNRWGPDYDCSSLLFEAWDQAGVPVKWSGNMYTGSMYERFTANGFIDVTSQINLSTGSGLKKGDILLNTGSHTEMVCDNSGNIVGARISENDTIYADEVGDQTGEEIRIRSYYNYPWNYVLRYIENDVIESVSSNAYLSQSDMQKNARFIYNYFSSRGWTLNAIAGMLGNMQRESTINPGIWQSLKEGNMSGGFGLVQWTPATTLHDWANSKGLVPSDIVTQLKRIEYELENGLQYYQTESYPFSFSAFTKSTESPEYLASAFLYNYERAGVSAEDERRTNARNWYEYLLNYEPDDPDDPEPPEPPEPEPLKRNKMSLLMMYIATKRKV